MWKGAVSFGLVTVPVRMYSATESHDLQFRQVRKSDGSRIRYKRVAEADGAEVPYAEIAKGYETPDGRTVILTDEDLASLPTKVSKEINVDKFVPRSEIDPILFDKAYYLEPDKAAAKAYSLLRETLKDADQVAMATVSVRSRMTLAVLRVRDDVIVLQTLLWPDEVRVPDFDVLAEVPEPTAKEVAMAQLLVASMEGEYDPGEYADDYREAVEALVARKIEGGEVTTPEAPEDSPGQVVDLLAALQKSVDRAKAARAAAAAAAGGAEGDGGAEQEEGEGEAGVAAEGVDQATLDLAPEHDPKAKKPAKKAAKKAAPRATKAG